MKISAVTAGMLQDVAELAAIAVLTKTGALTAYVSKAEAINIVGGESILNRWIKEGLIKVVKDGPANAKIRISRMQLESVLKVSNRPSYLSVEERNL